MAPWLNLEVAARLDEVARLLHDQGANSFRVDAYRRGAEAIRRLDRPVSVTLGKEGLEGLERLPAIGPSLARAIRDLVETGRLPMLERLRGESDAVRLRKGPDRPVADDPPVEELLDVDRQYRRDSAAGRLRMIAPRRMNPNREAWLPILHTDRGDRRYTALFSNTPRAHELGRTHDWVVLYADGERQERQYTVVTAFRGALKGRRIVRGREAECLAYYRARGLRVPAGEPEFSEA